ncbi:hypothetical protein [Bacillus canaveralius]|uniref:hypothetical protein n=1 Tax=Bacillus canaveralius TaxID=1403243 RepID=UPI001FE4F7A6|nr:hypothetical protein [Bacillus canaveralius]
MDHNNGFRLEYQQPNFGHLADQDYRDIKSLCKKYMSYHVIGHRSDGSSMDGILDSMDDGGITMLVPEDVEDDDRQFGGYGRRRYRRYRRRRYPYSFFVFPFFVPFPYYYPYW